MSEDLTYDEFLRVDLRVGTILTVKNLGGARKPAHILEIDFGPEIGTKVSSAQITLHYKPEELIGTQVVAVVNFPSKRIAGFESQVLVTGFPDEQDAVVQARQDNKSDERILTQPILHDHLGSVVRFGIIC